MRKWTYLVAALLIGGSAATFTGCIDNEEPAGITELRGAKAELLKAKAQVEAADAAYRLAETAWMQAKADYEAELAKQEAFKTQWHEAYTASEKQRIEQEMQKSAEQFKADLLAKQQATAIAQAEYDKAIIAIEAALVGYKESVYTVELEKLLADKVSVTYQKWDQTLNGGAGGWSPTTDSATGLPGVAAKIANAQKSLAQLMREKAKIEFSYDVSSKISAVEGQLAMERGVLEGYKKNLDNLKTIAGTPYEDWNTKYQELEDAAKKLEADRTNLGIEEKEALKPIAEKEKANTDAAALTSELTFVIPDAIQDDFYNNIDGSLSAYTPSGAAAPFNFHSQASKDAEGIYSYPNGVTTMLKMADKATLLDDMLNLIEQDYVIADNELEQGKIKLEQLKNVNDGNQVVYAEYLKTWKDALDAYTKLFNDGKYYAPNINDYAVIKAEYQEYLALPESDATEIAAKEAAQKLFAANLKSYLTKRMALDGFKITKTADATKVIDPTVAADWTQWDALTSDDARFGGDVYHSDIADGGAYKDYKDAAEKLGYLYNINPRDGRCVEYTYAEYLENGSEGPGTNSSSERTLWDNGDTKTVFENCEAYEELKSAIDNKPSWDKLYADVKALSDANAKVQDDLNLLIAAVAAEKAEIEAEYAAKESAIDVEKAGIEDIQSKIKDVIKTAAGSQKTAYDAILQDLKYQIAVLEGGSVTNTGDDYNFNSSSSIPGQQVVVASYEKLLAALKDGSYKPAEEALIAQKQAAIESKQVEIDVWTALFKSLSAKKDQLLAALAGTTPAQ